MLCCLPKTLKHSADYKNVKSNISLCNLIKHLGMLRRFSESIKPTVLLINTEIIFSYLNGRNWWMGIHISNVFISLDCQTCPYPEGVCHGHLPITYLVNRTRYFYSVMHCPHPALSVFNPLRVSAISQYYRAYLFMRYWRASSIPKSFHEMTVCR